jgi:hypothetical protein
MFFDRNRLTWRLEKAVILCPLPVRSSCTYRLNSGGYIGWEKGAKGLELSTYCRLTPGDPLGPAQSDWAVANAKPICQNVSLQDLTPLYNSITKREINKWQSTIASETTKGS